MTGFSHETREVADWIDQQMHRREIGDRQLGENGVAVGVGFMVDFCRICRMSEEFVIHLLAQSFVSYSETC